MFARFLGFYHYTSPSHMLYAQLCYSHYTAIYHIYNIIFITVAPFVNTLKFWGVVWGCWGGRLNIPFDVLVFHSKNNHYLEKRKGSLLLCRLPSGHLSITELSRFLHLYIFSLPLLHLNNNNSSRSLGLVQASIFRTHTAENIILFQRCISPSMSQTTKHSHFGYSHNLTCILVPTRILSSAQYSCSLSIHGCSKFHFLLSKVVSLLPSETYKYVYSKYVPHGEATSSL